MGTALELPDGDLAMSIFHEKDSKTKWNRFYQKMNRAAMAKFDKRLVKFSI